MEWFRALDAIAICRLKATTVTSFRPETAGKCTMQMLPQALRCCISNNSGRIGAGFFFAVRTTPHHLSELRAVIILTRKMPKQVSG